MATYLVTGAAGFIGSALVRELLERGQTVRAVDNLLTGKRENVAEVLARIDFREVDILEVAELRRACEGVDCILHQAALCSVPRSIEDPEKTNRINVQGTLNVLLAAREAGVKRIVYAASSSAYGDTLVLPKREDMPPRPKSPYAVSKLTGEYYMQAFAEVHGLETVSLRYFNVFGPRQDENSPYSAVLARFISLMLAGKCPTIFGDGEQTRDFTYVDNVVEANLLACRAAAEEVRGRVFNIATGSRISLNQTFVLLKRLTEFEGEAAYGRPRPGDVRDSQADLTLAARHLGYRPKVEFEEGLARTVAWYREKIGEEVASPRAT